MGWVGLCEATLFCCVGMFQGREVNTGGHSVRDSVVRSMQMGAQEHRSNLTPKLGRHITDSKQQIPNLTLATSLVFIRIAGKTRLRPVMCAR